MSDLHKEVCQVFMRSALLMLIWRNEILIVLASVFHTKRIRRGWPGSVPGLPTSWRVAFTRAPAWSMAFLLSATVTVKQQKPIARNSRRESKKTCCLLAWDVCQGRQPYECVPCRIPGRPGYRDAAYKNPGVHQAILAGLRATCIFLQYSWVVEGTVLESKESTHPPPPTPQPFLDSLQEPRRHQEFPTHSELIPSIQ